jgi:predicted nucleic acid-binding protein
VNAYLDSSALVKMLIDEPGSDALQATMATAQPFSCRITYAETRAAVARREREAPERSDHWASARAQLAVDWAKFGVVEVVQPVVERAGELADLFALRGYDAVQLAAARALHDELGEPLTFVCYDRRLNRAARLLGLTLPEGAPD